MTLQAHGSGRGISAPYLLYELTQAVSAARRPEDIYDAALTCLRESLGVERSAILLFDDAGIMRFKAWRELSPEYRAAVDGHSPWTDEDSDPLPVLVSDVRLDESLAGLRPVIEGEGIRSLAFIPLTIGGHLLGKFMLYYAEPHVFDDIEVMTARTIGSQVAFAIDQRNQRVHLDAMYRSNVTGILEIDARGRLRRVNDRFCEIAGRTREELLAGTYSYELVDPADRQAAKDGLARLIAGVDDFTQESRYRRPDGSLVWVSNNVSAVRDDAGSLTGAIATVSDITERRRADDALRESERRYRELLAAQGLAVYTTDADGVIQLYNEAAAQLWGRRPVIGKDVWCGSWQIYWPDGTPVDLA